MISNEELSGIMKIVKSTEESGLFTKSASETIKNESKKQISHQYLCRLVVSLLGNLLTGRAAIRAGVLTIIAGQDF